jgi:hypothetical protein
MTAHDDVVAAGAAAWVRLRDRQRLSWVDWVQVGLALQIGPSEALKAAGTNAPFGKVYTKFMTGWLRANGFDDINQQVRYRLLQCIENIIAIEKWRSGLDEQSRRKYNHPDSVWANWRRSTSITPSRCADPRPRPQFTGKAVNGSYHRPVHFGQDVIRRAGQAMREAWSNDVYKLAAVALHAAIRNEGDLLALLPAASAAPQRSVDRAHADA